MHDPALSTATVARMAGLSAERIRQLEREGAIVAAERDSTGKRIFRQSDVLRFLRQREQMTEALATR